MRPGLQTPLAIALVDAPPRVADLSFALVRAIRSYSSVEVLAALSEITAWVVAEHLADEDAIGPVLELWTRRTREHAAIIFAAGRAPVLELRSHARRDQHS